MQEENYVSFYTAILLKEKHFIGRCHKCYYQYKEDNNKVCLEDIHGDSGEVEAPTLQMQGQHTIERHSQETERIRYNHHNSHRNT